MKDKHTPEPWEVTDKRFIRQSSGRRHVVARVVGSEEMEANARRIVACINACAGIPTEGLEKTRLGSDVLLEMHKISQQRDDLLATLKAVTSIAHCGGLSGMSDGEALIAIRRMTLPYFDKAATLEQHRAAIASVKESK